jgi:2-dehydropantoate 2-reductase
VEAENTRASARREIVVQQQAWPKVAVVGAGAVGCYFGGMLARAGAPVTLIGRQQHVDAIGRNGLFLDTLHFQESVPVAASTRIEAAHGAQLVLFCVKSFDTEEAARLLAPHLAPEALVLSCQNGVDNVQRFAKSSGMSAIPAIVYVAAAMSGPGRVKHSGSGNLVIGNLPQGQGGGLRDRRELEEFAGVLARGGIPCQVSENIEGELWVKMIINCAYNAISALGRSRYIVMTGRPLVRQLMCTAVEESIAVARALGVQLPDTDLVESTINLAQTMKNATSSTAQDIARGKRTEIDSLNGYVVRHGKERGIPVPVNQTLYTLVKLLEDNTLAVTPGQ